MSSSIPAAAFAATVKRLAASDAAARHMAKYGPPAAQAVGRAVLAAVLAGKDDTEAGCVAFRAALAPALDEAGTLAKHGNQRQRQVSGAVLQAAAAAAAIDWQAKPALGRVTTVSGPGDVQASATASVVVRTALRRDGDLTAAASCGWTYAGLAPSPLTDLAVFPAGSADAEAAVTVPAQPGMAGIVDFSFAVQPPFVGLDPTPPPPVRGRLLPPGGAAVPVLTVAPPASVQVSRTLPVDVHAPASLDKPAPAGGSSVDFLAGGVPAQMFVGDTFPVGTVTVPEGLTAHPDAAVRFQLKPQSDTTWRRGRVSLALSNPVRATLAAGSVGVDVIGAGGGGPVDTGPLPWLSGVCLPPNDIGILAALDAQAAWRGSPYKLYKLKSNGTGSDPQLLSSLQQKAPIIAGLTARKVATAITIDFITHEHPRGFVVQAAQGALDNLWDTISRIVAGWDVYGPELWIVAGHEVGSTYMHGADSDPDQTNYSHYKETMRRFRVAMQARNPKVRIDQSFIRRPQSINIARAFAGPDGCDGVGHDPYGNPGGGIKSAADFQKFANGMDANGPTGPASMIAFAKSVGKRFTAAEWGPAGGDEPAYVQGMFDLLHQNAADVAYEAQFCISDASSGKDHRLGPGANPQASALYRRLWGGGG